MSELRGWVWGVVLVACVGLAGCGDDEDDAPPPAAADDAGMPDADDAAEDAGEDAVVEPRPLDDPAVVAYCDCMFLSCHDIYHAVWGEDELVARDSCLEAASVLPDGEASSGASLTCRQRACDAAACDEAAALVECGE